MKNLVLSVALALMLFATGLGVTTSISDFQFWYQSTRQTLILIWLFILLYLLLTRRLSPLFREIVRFHRRTAAVALLWLLTVTASYLSSPFYGPGNPLVLMRLAEMFTYLFLYVVLWDFFSHHKPDYSLICAGIIFSAILITLLFLLGSLFELPARGVLKLPLPYWGDIHINDNIRRIGYLLETAIVVTLCFWKERRSKIPLLILLIPLLIFLLWLGGRASILGTFTALLFYGVVTGGYRRTSRYTTLGGALFLLLLISLFYGMDIGNLGAMIERTLGTSDFDQISTGRLSLWSSVLDEWSRHPLLGSGPQSFFFYPNRGEMIIHPHNFLLQFLGEWGVLGTLPLLYLLFLALRSGWREYRDDSTPVRSVRIIGATLILALTVTGLFAGTYFFSQTSLLLIVAYALWASSPVSHSDQSSS